MCSGASSAEQALQDNVDARKTRQNAWRYEDGINADETDLTKRSRTLTHHIPAKTEYRKENHPVG
jgi:hypothetical protein